MLKRLAYRQVLPRSLSSAVFTIPQINYLCELCILTWEMWAQNYYLIFDYRFDIDLRHSKSLVRTVMKNVGGWRGTLDCVMRDEYLCFPMGMVPLLSSVSLLTVLHYLC